MARRAFTFLALLLLIGCGAHADPVTLTGSVVDGEGQPVADAQVWVVRNDFDLASYRMTPRAIAEGRTDAEGSCTLTEVDWPGAATPWQHSVIIAYKPGLALGWRHIEQPGLPVEIALLKPQLIGGTVQDPEGNGIAAVHVSVTHAAFVKETASGRDEGEWFMAPPDLLPSLLATTDKNGVFSFEVVPPNVRLGVEITAAGYGTVTAMVSEKSPGVIKLGRAAALEGRFVCEEPAEAAGMMIFLMGHFPSDIAPREGRGYVVQETVVAEEDGSFRLEELPPGKYRVMLIARAEDKWQATEKTELEVAPGAQIDDLDIKLARAWPITGRVVDAETAEPLADVRVSAYSETSQQQVMATTDENGEYLLHGLPGKVQLNYQAPNGYVSRVLDPGQDTSVTVTAGEETVAEDIRLHRAVTVRGVVVNERDELVAGAEVWAQNAQEQFRREIRTVSDQQGQFELTALNPEATGGIYARSENAVCVNPAPLRTGARDGLVRIVISERAASRVIGRVLDDRGEPVAGTGVTIMHQQERTSEGHTYTRLRSIEELDTDEDGRFESPVLIPDWDYTVRISGAGHAFVETEQWTAARGGVHDLGDITVVVARASLAGVVVDAAGKPLAGVTVFNAGDGPQRVSTVTDEQGRFELTGLFEGHAWAFAESADHYFTGALAPTGSTDLKIVLLPSDGPRPEAPGNPPALDLERDRRLAEEIALEGIELTRGTRTHNDGIMFGALARVNPTRGVEVWDEEGEPTESLMLSGLADALLETDPDAAIDRLWNAESAYTRAYHLNKFGRKLMPRNPELAAEAFSLAASAARAIGTEGWGILSLADAGRGLVQLGRTEGEQVANEAFAMAQQLGKEEREDCHTRGTVAEAMCLVDLEAALSLLEGIPTEGPNSYGHDDHLEKMACALASRDPDQAEQLLSRMRRGGITRVGGSGEFAYEMAAKDPERALNWARQVRNERERVLAIGYLALRFAETDRERALGLIDEAVQIAVQEGDMYGSVSGYWTATNMGRLAHVAAQMGYPDLAGLVARAMSLRPEETTVTEADRKAESIAQLAQSIAWLDTEAARRLLEPVVASLLPNLADMKYHVSKVVVAAAAVDPEWAVEILRSLPDDDPQSDRRPQAVSYRELAEFLSLAPEARVYEALHFWMPGAPPE